MSATATNLTVSSMKKAAVKTAARNGVQPGRAARSTYCGAASIGDVTIVSRRPVGASGR